MLNFEWIQFAEKHLFNKPKNESITIHNVVLAIEHYINVQTRRFIDEASICRNVMVFDIIPPGMESLCELSKDSGNFVFYSDNRNGVVRFFVEDTPGTIRVPVFEIKQTFNLYETTPEHLLNNIKDKFLNIENNIFEKLVTSSCLSTNNIIKYNSNMCADEIIFEVHKKMKFVLNIAMGEENYEKFVFNNDTKLNNFSRHNSFNSSLLGWFDFLNPNDRKLYQNRLHFFKQNLNNKIFCFPSPEFVGVVSYKKDISAKIDSLGSLHVSYDLGMLLVAPQEVFMLKQV